MRISPASRRPYATQTIRPGSGDCMIATHIRNHGDNSAVPRRIFGAPADTRGQEPRTTSEGRFCPVRIEVEMSRRLANRIALCVESRPRP